MYLTLADVCVKIHLNPYESRIGGLMEKFNDALVLMMCYFLYLFTSLIPGHEDKYLIGWIYMCIVASLLMANLSVMVHGSL